jgi:hypothetical protein
MQTPIEREPRSITHITILILIIAVLIGLLIFALKGDSACACDNVPFQTINSGLVPDRP